MCVGCVCWVCVGCVLYVCWACVRCVLGLCWMYLTSYQTLIPKLSRLTGVHIQSLFRMQHLTQVTKRLEIIEGISCA